MLADLIVLARWESGSFGLTGSGILLVAFVVIFVAAGLGGGGKQ